MVGSASTVILNYRDSTNIATYSDNRSDKLESQPLQVKALSSDEQLGSIH